MAWTTPKTDFNAGDVLTAANMNAIGENLEAIYDGRRLATVTQSGAGTVNSVASGNMNKLFPSDLTFTADGTSTYFVEVHVPLLNAATTAGAYLVIYVTDSAGAAVGGALGFSPVSNGTYSGLGYMYARFPYVPSAGSVSLNVGATHAVAAGSIGSSGSTRLAYMSVYGPQLP